MIEQIKQLKNNVYLYGKLDQLEAKEGKNQVGNDYISVNGKVRFGEDTIHIKNFSCYAAEKTQAGTHSKKYDSVKEFYEKNKDKTVVKIGFDNAVTISVSGNFSALDYVGSDGMLKEGVSIKAGFFNDGSVNDDGTPRMGAIADVECYIDSVNHEVKGENETGRLRLTLLTNDFMGNLIVLKNVIVPAEDAEDFESIYERGQTITASLEYRISGNAPTPKKAAFGKMHTNTTNYLELVIVGAEEPLFEDDPGAITAEQIKAAKIVRKEKLAEIEAKGYQGTGGSSILPSDKRAAAKAAAENIDDDDIPF